ncbi:MAG TPA: hypothetical protein VJ654_02850 [Noviherbaspirillum sp.]|nr:hypothetical protein [Noviherbaspirillum sp.]
MKQRQREQILTALDCLTIEQGDIVLGIVNAFVDEQKNARTRFRLLPGGRSAVGVIDSLSDSPANFKKGNTLRMCAVRVAVDNLK